MKLRIGSLLAGGVAMSIIVAPASATTFCVPSFHAACPDNGSNVEQTSLQTAMLTSGDDMVADTIAIAAGTVTDIDSYTLDSGDNDDLEIVGAGPAATTITSTQSGNQFVINLNGAREVTMRDLTIRIPASMPDNQGGALQAEKDLFENVDIESRNVRSDGGNSMIGGSTFRDGRVYGSMGGSIDVGFATNGAESGELLIERTSIESPSWGVVAQDGNIAVRVKRSRIIDPLAYGVRITNGGFAVVDNSIIEADTGYPVIAESNDAGTVIVTVRHTTIVGPPPDQNDPAIKAIVHNVVGNGPVNLVVTDTIIAGYDNPLWCEAPTAANIGNANLTVRYSYFFHSASVIGDCTLSNPNTIDAFDPQVGPPQFAGAGDYHLPASSPAIDNGDPATVTLPTEDFDGAPRPVDGDGDGSSRRDMGAFEYQLPVVNPPVVDPPPGGDPPSGDPPPADPLPDPNRADIQPPMISKLKAKRGFSARGGGIVKLRLSEASNVSLAFRPTAKRRSAHGLLKLSFAGASGKNKLRLKPRRLDPGRHRLKVIAVDAAGNRSTPARTRLVVSR